MESTESRLNRRRWIVLAFVAVMVLASGVVVWYLFPLPSFDVDPAMRGTVAAQVLLATGALPSQDAAALDAKILEVSGRPDDSWVCVGDWPPEQVAGMSYWRQEYAFNDGSRLFVYSGGPDLRGREFDGVLIEMVEPLHE